MKYSTRGKGFTLIELLVVIAIVALLLSIMVPALSTVKQRAKIVICKTNFHQWGIAAKLYANNNAGWYPAHNINATTGENVWDIGYKFVLTMHDDYDIPYEMFFCPAQPQKYPGDDVAAFRSLMWYSLADQSDPTSTALSFTAALATLRFNWWIPRQTADKHWLPVELGRDPLIEPSNGAPRKDSDKGNSKPIMTDFCWSTMISNPPNVQKDITPSSSGGGGGHLMRGKFDSINLLYADGRVEVHKESDIQPRFKSRQRYEWW
jgi:prepilin-type N-terminal cleavage/methylation domain-containing protein